MRKALFLVVVAIVFVLFIYTYISAPTLSSGPPSIDLFVEDWDKCPSPFQHMVILGGSRGYRLHEVKMVADFTPPRWVMIYRYEFNRSLIDEIAMKLGLVRVPINGVLEYANGTAVSGPANNNSAILEVDSVGSEVTYSRGIIPAMKLFGISEPMIGWREIRLAEAWLRRLGLYPNNIERVEIHGYRIDYYLRYTFYENVSGYVNEYPEIEVAVIGGRVVYAEVCLACIYAKPWRMLRSRSIEDAVRILKATLDIGGVLRNARGWSPDKDARLLASPHPMDFRYVVINEVSMTLVGTHDVPLRPGEEAKCRYSYLIPVYIFKGVTDKGERFYSLVDAVDRSSEPRTVAG